MQPLNAREQRRILSAWFPGRAKGCKVLPAWWPGCGAASEVQRELDAQDALPVAALTNPLYLTLIAAFRADPANHRALPTSLRSAFSGYVARRLSRVADLDQGAPAADTLGRAAARLALRILTDQGRGTTHDQQSLVAALTDAGWDLDLAPGQAEQWLYRAKLGRILGTGTGRQRRFEFLHRRVLEHFALQGLLEALPDLPEEAPSRDPRAPVSLAELMSADLWREVVAGVLTAADTPGRARLIAAIRSRLQTLADALPASQGVTWPNGPPPPGLLVAEEHRLANADASEVAFNWPDGAAAVLALLQRAGEAAGVPDEPTALVADRLLLAAWLHGGDADRAEVLALARAGSDAGMAELLAAGFRVPNWLLGCRSFEQAMRLPALPEVLIAPVREGLVVRWLIQTPVPSAQRAIQRRVERLDPTGGLRKAFDLLRSFRKIDAYWYKNPGVFLAVSWLFVAFAIWLDQGDTEIFGGVLIVPLIVYWPVVFLRGSRSADIVISCQLRTHSAYMWRFWLLPTFFSRAVQVGWFYVALRFLVAGASVDGTDGTTHTMEPMSFEEALLWIGGPWVLAVLGLIWGVCAPLAVMSGRLLKPWKWPFLPILPILLAPGWFRRINSPGGGKRGGVEPAWLRLLRFFLAWMGVAVLLDPWVYKGQGGPDFSLWSEWEASLFVFTGIPILGIELRALIPALRVRLSSEPLEVAMLLDLSSARYGIQGERGRHSLLSWGRRSPRLKADQTVLALIQGAIRAIERDARRRAHQPRRWSPLAWWRAAPPEPDAAWAEDVKTWYRRYSRRGSGVAYLDGVVLHDLIELRDALRARLAADAE